MCVLACFRIRVITNSLIHRCDAIDVPIYPESLFEIQLWTTRGGDKLAYTARNIVMNITSVRISVSLFGVQVCDIVVKGCHVV
jgi:hypothetical protein